MSPRCRTSTASHAAAALALWLGVALLASSGPGCSPAAPSHGDARAVAADSRALPPDADSAGPAADGAAGDGPGEPPLPALRLAVISDINDSYGATSYGSPLHAAIAQLKTTRPDIVLITGDMVAGQQAGLNYGAMWSALFTDVVEPLRAAGIVVAVTPGNHDASGYPSFAGERQIFIDQWSKPARRPKVQMVDDSAYPLRYSFVYKGVFFVSLDATTVGPLSAVQRSWVDAQLEAAQGHALRVAFGHLPLHPVTKGRETEVLGDDALEQIFASRKLSLYVSGHHHGFYPGAAGGVRQVSAGCLGSGPRALIGTSATTPRSLLLVEIDQGAIVSLEATAASAFSQTISRASLPAALSYGGHTLTRDDLAGF